MQSIVQKNTWATESLRLPSRHPHITKTLDMAFDTMDWLDEKVPASKFIAYPLLGAPGYTYAAGYALRAAAYKISTKHLPEVHRGDLAFKSENHEIDTFCDVLEQHFIGDHEIRKIVQDASQKKNWRIPFSHGMNDVSIRIKTVKHSASLSQIECGKEPGRLKVTLNGRQPCSIEAALHVVDYWRKHGQHFPELKWQQAKGYRLKSKPMRNGNACPTFQVISNRPMHARRMYALEERELILRQKMAERCALWEEIGPKQDRAKAKLGDQYHLNKKNEEQNKTFQEKKMTLVQKWQREDEADLGNNPAANILARDMQNALLESMGFYQRPFAVDATIRLIQKLLAEKDSSGALATLTSKLSMSDDIASDMPPEDRVDLVEHLHNLLVSDGLRLPCKQDDSEPALALSEHFNLQSAKEQYCDVDSRLKDALLHEYRAINNRSSEERLIDAGEHGLSWSKLWGIFNQKNVTHIGPDIQLKNHRRYQEQRRMDAQVQEETGRESHS